MAEAANFLSTPEGYATPEQLQSTRDYAKALLYGNGQQPIHHWTQGLSNIVSALVGGGLDYNAAQQQKAALKNQVSQQNANIPTGNYPDKPSFSEGPSSAGGKNADGGDDLDRAAKVTSNQESGGNYQSVGNVTKNGDRAYGKYQVMGNNVPQWTAEALGKPMNIADFVHSPEAQDAVYKHKMGQYMAKYGPEGAARAWFAGEAGMKNPNATDVNHMSVDRYGKNFASAFARSGGGAPSPAAAPTATAFSGPQDASGTPAVQAITSALRGGPAPAAGGTQVAGSPQVAAARGAAPAPIMNPSGNTAPLINPALIKPQPGYTHDQLLAVMSNPWTSPAEKQQAYDMALRQGQAVFMPSPTGSGQVLLDPRNPQSQQFFADKPTFTKRKIGDIEREVPVTLGPHGEQIEAPRPVMRPALPVPGLGPRSDAAPAAAGVAPVAAPTGAAPLGAAPGTATAENAPAAPAEAPDVPVQVASTDPTAGVSATVGKAPAQTAAKAAPEPAPLTKMAQAGPPPGVDPEDWAAYTQKQAQDTKVAVDKESQIESTKASAKKYDTLSTQGQNARKQMPNLDLALAMLNDPNMHQGMLAGVQDIWSRFKAAALGEQYANAPNETFDKLLSGSILDNMKTALGGLGQVRLAEISLLTKANANRSNTDASNRAVLEVSRRAVQSIDHLDQIGQQYASGDEVVDPLDPTHVLLKANVQNGEIVPRHGLDVGYDKLARQFVKEHPTFTPDEIKHYETIFDTGKDPSAVQASGHGAPQGGDMPPPAALQHLKAGTPTTFQNGQQWTLGADGKPQRLK